MPLVPGPPFDALGDHADGRRGRLCLSRCLPLVLLAGLIGLPPLAYPSPPDPVRIPGFYGDADHDARWLVAESAVQSAP
jgi:hypothetical protein